MVETLQSTLLPSTPHAFSLKDGLPDEPLVERGEGVRVKQVHSAIVVDAEAALGEALEADALVTDRPGRILQIVTADCAPVLLADVDAGVVAAAHAGWRGAVGDILGHTVSAMIERGARSARIVAAIGPTICQASYEVDDRFRDAFPTDADPFFVSGNPGHFQFDLPGFCALRLSQAGVLNIDDLAQDTYSQPTRFYSFRRATHAGKPTGGRQISAIALPHG